MLDTEPQIVENYVKTGEVQIVFWPVLNHGDPSTFSTLTAECVAQQSTDAFWDIHQTLFETQQQTWGADRDYYINLAVQTGVDQATFEACYDGGDGLAKILELDAIRRERGVYTQPIFDVNGEIFGGYQQFDFYVEVFGFFLEN